MTTSFPPHWPVTACHALGHRGAVAVVGTGKPVVLLPSLFALPRSYRPTVEALARRFRVFVVEVPGSGNGERLSRPWSLEEYARWVAEVLRQLALAGVTLVGHSHAGAVAVHVAAACPERVARLIVVDGVGAARLPVVRTVIGGLIDLALEWRLVLRAWPDVIGNLVRHLRTFLHHFAICFTATVLTTASRLRIRTTITWGGRDHTLPYSLGEKFAAAVPGATMVTCEAGSHNWIITYPDEFARIV